MTTKSVSSNYYNSAEDLELADGGQDDLGKRTSAASASNFRTKWTNEEFEEGCGLKEPDHRATTSTSPFLADFDPNECDLNDFKIIDYLNDEFRDINPAISVNSNCYSVGDLSEEVLQDLFKIGFLDRKISGVFALARATPRKQRRKFSTDQERKRAKCDRDRIWRKKNRDIENARAKRFYERRKAAHSSMNLSARESESPYASGATSAISSSEESSIPTK